jgi:hypothetical protein
MPKENDTLKIISIVSGIILFLAIFSWPYGYYMFLRVAIFFASIYLSTQLKEHEGWRWIFIFMAILYNPLFEIHLTKGLWVPINIASAILFFSVPKK